MPHMIGPRNQPASSLNEGQARYILIDPALRGAGWNLEDRTQVGFEIPVDGYDAAPWNGVTDYCLYAPGGEVIAIVEAKRCSRNAREADEQLRHYVTEIAKRQSYAPFGFMANGLQTWFWEVGLANPRVVAGFFSPQDLQRLLFLRQNARPLQNTAINTSIVEPGAAGALQTGKFLRVRRFAPQRFSRTAQFFKRGVHLLRRSATAWAGRAPA